MSFLHVCLSRYGLVQGIGCDALVRQPVVPPIDLPQHVKSDCRVRTMPGHGRDRCVLHTKMYPGTKKRGSEREGHTRGVGRRQSNWGRLSSFFSYHHGRGGFLEVVHERRWRAQRLVCHPTSAAIWPHDWVDGAEGALACRRPFGAVLACHSYTQSDEWHFRLQYQPSAAEGIMIGVRAACRAPADGCRQRLPTALRHDRTLWHGARLEVIVCSEAVVTERTRHGAVGRAGTLLTVGSRRSTLAYLHRTVCAGAAASVYALWRVSLAHANAPPCAHGIRDLYMATCLGLPSQAASVFPDPHRPSTQRGQLEARCSTAATR